MTLTNRLLPRLILACLPFMLSSAYALETASTEGIKAQEQSKTIESVEKTPSSNVFGAHLFTGQFSNQKLSGFSPEYRISVGDKIRTQMWGAHAMNDVLTVDQQGNIFIEQIGPVRVLGVRNNDLNKIVLAKVSEIFQSNVHTYTNLEAAQPVNVFVTGNVVKPGLYGGLSTNSLLYYLDKSGGIDLERGSFLSVKVLRGGKQMRHLNLYDFLLTGKLEPIQFLEGDTIFVDPIKSTIAISGSANNAHQFEFPTQKISMIEALSYARPKAEATHLRIIRRLGTERNVSYFPLEKAKEVALYAGDLVELTSDQPKGTIIVSVNGEHTGKNEYALPYNARLSDIMVQIPFGHSSEVRALQLFRKSVALKQKESINRSLDSLETSLLTSRSELVDEATIRIKEAELLKDFISRAREVEPKGQVILGSFAKAQDMRLEDGDVIHIPGKTSVVLIQGEVRFPTSALYDPRRPLSGYIELAGGISQNGNQDRVILIKASGEVTNLGRGPFGWGSRNGQIQPGDEIMVMPKINSKGLLFAKEVVDVVYKIAISTASILRIK